jgi:hypothetical protein
MDITRLQMQTGSKNSFSYLEGYDGVSTEELQELLRLGRATVLSLEKELERRKTSGSDEIPGAVKTCIDKIQKSIYTLRIVQHLDHRASLISAAADSLKNDHKHRGGKLYKQFLRDVQRQCGGGLVVLCSSSLGKQRIVDLKSSDRIFLLSYLKLNSSSLKHAVLDRLAESHGIMNAPNDPIPGSSNAQTLTYPISAERRKPSLILHCALADRLHAEIEYKYSEAPIAAVIMLGPYLCPALQTSRQWKWERETGGLTTDCISALSPKHRGDITLHLVVGFEEGTELIEKLQMQAV